MRAGISCSTGRWISSSSARIGLPAGATLPNKIGTYLKALAAHDNGVPFYVALPSSTFDFSLDDGVAEIPIEERGAAEVRIMSGKTPDGQRGLTFRFVRTKPPPGTGRSTSPRIGSSQGAFPNAAFCQATQEGIASLYPESAGTARHDR